MGGKTQQQIIVIHQVLARYAREAWPAALQACPPFNGGPTRTVLNCFQGPGPGALLACGPWSRVVRRALNFVGGQERAGEGLARRRQGCYAVLVARLEVHLLFTAPNLAMKVPICPSTAGFF